MITKRWMTTLFGVGLLVVGIDRPAYAEGFKFDFNALAVGGTAAAVQTYMNGVLGAGKSVAVTSNAGQIVNHNYTGDGHVVGPGGVSVTLGTTDGNGVASGPDDNFLYTHGGTWIKMLFTGVEISDISFDYQIFPDPSCKVGDCSAFPDFTFKTKTGAADWNTVLHAFGAFPVIGNQESPVTIGNNKVEKYAQLGPTTFSQHLGPGVVGLWFIDWPPTIGIDNLCINCVEIDDQCTDGSCAPVPEPASMLLVGTGLAGLVARRRARRAQR